MSEGGREGNKSCRELLKLSVPHFLIDLRTEKRPTPYFLVFSKPL